jgi:hypothetical protein
MSTARANRYAAVANARATIARLLVLVATAVALVLVAGILLVVLDANASNAIVRAIHDAAKFLAGPFDGMFTLNGRKATVAVNWGIAAAVWYALGHVLARLMLRR